MLIDKIYSKVRRSLRKALLNFLDKTYQNETLDSLEAKLVTLALKTVVSSYLKVGVVIPDKAYEAMGKEVAEALDKINLKLQERLKDDEQ